MATSNIINAQVREEGLSWILDAYENYDADEEQITDEVESWDDARFERFMNKRYEGGLEQFLMDGDLTDS